MQWRQHNQQQWKHSNQRCISLQHLGSTICLNCHGVQQQRWRRNRLIWLLRLWLHFLFLSFRCKQAISCSHCLKCIFVYIRQELSRSIATCVM